TELSDIEKYLKGQYESLVTVPLSPSGKEDDYVKISDVYVNIEFRKVEITDLNYDESNSLYGTQREKEPLITMDEDTRKKTKFVCPILIFGDCGSGKSAWCKHLVQSWLQGVDIKDDTIDLNLPDLRNIKIVLYLPLQFTDRGISFQELLEKHIFKETKSYQEFVMKYVKTNAHQILIVMDGLDVVKEKIKPILDILNDKHMSMCTVIITSRPASLKLLQDRCHANIEQMMLFRICKMTPEDSKLYASNVLDYINRLHGKNLKIVNFCRFTEQLHVQDLLSVPYICLVLLHVWMENENCFIEATDILFDIIRFYLLRATSDQQRREFIEDTSYIRSTNVLNDLTKFNKWKVLKEHRYFLHVLSRIAIQKFYCEIEREPMKQNVPQLFPIKDEDDIDMQRICETGLLTEPLSLSANKKASDMLFPDRIIYEFFVSLCIALREGKDCDFISPWLATSVQPSMVIQILFQLSDSLTNDIIHRAIEIFDKEDTTNMGDNGRNYSNEKIVFSIASSDGSAVLWLQRLMCNDAINEHKLMLMSTALHCIDTITSLEFKIDLNNENLVLHLPCLPVLESLTLDISKCTLVLCKEWDTRVPCKLKHVVIGSVSISKCILSLLICYLAECEGLETLKLSPSVVWTDEGMKLQKKPHLEAYSWNKLSKHIETYRKLKILELQNLILPGEVDILLSRLNRYQNLEILTLTNVSSIIQKQPSLSPSCDTDNDDDVIQYTKVNLTQLSLDKIKLKQSPINFMFNSATKGKPNGNNINVFSISALEMPETSWETLGRQISNLSLTEFHLSSVNPGDSLQIILDGIGQIKTLNSLTLRKIVTGKNIPSFLFLSKMNKLSQIKLRDMKLDGSSSHSFFRHICGCRSLQKLSLCNIDFKEIPKTLSLVQNLTKLSSLTVYRVTIQGGSKTLIDFFNVFCKCKILQTLQISKENASSVPKKLSDIKVIYLDNI
ncbi:hypothetical protein ACJMK2_042305, partial [Sinanodonta woodiana]